MKKWYFALTTLLLFAVACVPTSGSETAVDASSESDSPVEVDVVDEPADPRSAGVV